MSSILEELKMMEFVGTSSSEIDIWKNNKRLELMSHGMNEEQINKEFGIFDHSKDESLLGPIKNYWGGIVNDIKKDGLLEYGKKWAVGEDAEWETYFERGIGKSNINLIKQFHSGGKEDFNDSFLGFLTPDHLNYDYKNAFSEEPSDTGHIERFFETITALGADLPTFIGGAILGSPAGKYGSAFTAGFVNDSIKATYLEALDKGQVQNFSEWWDIFLKHGVEEGTKGGLTLTSMVAAPNVLPYIGLKKNFINKFVSRWVALSYTPVMLGEQMPDKNTLIQNALLLSTLGIAEKGSSMVIKRSVKNKKEIDQNTKDLMENKDMIEDAGSLNKKTFRNDKKIDEVKIKELKSELKKLEKPVEKPIEKKIEFKIGTEVIISKKGNKAKIIREGFYDKKRGQTLDDVTYYVVETASGKNYSINKTLLKKFNKVEKPIEKEIKPELKKLEEKQQKIFQDIEIMREEKATGLEIDQAKFSALEKELGKVETAIKEFKPEAVGKVETKEITELKAEIARLEDLKTKDPNKIPIKEYITLEENLKTAKEKLDTLTKVEKPVEKDVVKTQLEEFYKTKRIEEIKQELDNLEVMPKMEISKNKTDIETSNSIIKDGLKKLKFGKIEKLEGQDWKSALITTWLDGLYPILKAERKAKKLVKYPKDAPTPYTEMRSQHGMIGKAMHFIKFGTLDFATQKINGKSLLDIWLNKVSFGKKIADMKAELKEAEIKLKEFEMVKNKDLIKETKIRIKDLEKNIEIEMKNIKGRKPLDEYAKASGYLAHKRNVELVEKRKKDTGIDVETSKKYIEVKEIKENYEGLQKEIVQYSERKVDYMVEAGVISKELAKIIKELNRDYVPFHRVIEDAHTGSTFSKVVKNPFKRIKGSKKDIADPIESVFLNTVRFVQIAERNAAYTSFFDGLVTPAKAKAAELKQADPFPDIQIAKTPIRKIHLVKEDFKNILVDWKNLTEKQLDGLAIFRKDSQILSDKQVAVYKDGVRTVWEVPPDISAALNGMNKFSAHWIRDTIGLPSQWLRAGATLNPEFMARNISRDTFYGASYSKNTFFIPIVSSIRGLFLRHGKFNEKLYQEFIKSGASQSHLISIDQRYFRDGRMIDELYSRKFRNWLDPTKILENLRAVSEYTEVASRLADFELTMKRLTKQNEKLPPDKKLTYRQILHRAGFEGRDLTIDFRKMGYAVQAINQIAAFFNARIQGNLKLWEGMRDRPFQTTTKILSWITLPSVLLWLHNKDSEAYKRLPQWRKDLAWNLPINEGTDKEFIFSFPKAHGLALLFGSTIERTLDSIYQKNPEIIKDFAKQYSWESMVGLIPIPEFSKPFIEGFANKSTFTKRPIVPEGLKDILPEYQFTQYTSETAKLIGKIISKITNGKIGSPLMIDNWVQSWFGGLGDHMMSLMDVALTKAGVVVPPVDPKSDNWIKNLDDMLIIKAYIARNPDGNSEHLSKFWKTYHPISEQLATINKLKKSGNFEEFIHLFNRTEIELAFLENIAVTLRKNSQMVRMIQASTFMSANEKAQMIDQIYMMMIETAKMANDMVLTTRKFKKEYKKKKK